MRCLEKTPRSAGTVSPVRFRHSTRTLPSRFKAGPHTLWRNPAISAISATHRDSAADLKIVSGKTALVGSKICWCRRICWSGRGDLNS